MMKTTIFNRIAVVSVAIIYSCASAALVAGQEKPMPATQETNGAATEKGQSSGKTGDPILDAAVIRCTTVGYKAETADFRSCVLEQIKLLTNMFTKEGIEKLEKLAKLSDAAKSDATIVRTAPKLNVAKSPPPDNFYPPSLKKAGQSGVVTVRACPDASGKVSAEPTVSNSSGFPGLDDAAIMWARAAIFAPGTENGKPTTMCTIFNLRFRVGAMVPPDGSVVQ